VARAAKRLPQDVKDTLGVLLRTLGRLEADEIEPGRAQAIASVARAIVTVHENASLEARLEALEAIAADRKGRAS
jgi:BMFP domain-containing protein YqiC